jgi:hypothetical protein
MAGVVITTLPQCLRQQYGHGGGTDASGGDGGASSAESVGYVEAGDDGLIFPATPAPGSLLLATAMRFSYMTQVVPPTGVMSGFGATWERIDYQEATVSMGSSPFAGDSGGCAGFQEVWRAMQPAYTTGKAHYTLPGGYGGESNSNPIEGDGWFSDVTWMAFSGVNPAGLADNGASTISNLTQHTPTTSSSASYSQAPLQKAGNLTYNSFLRLSRDGDSSHASTTDLTPQFNWYESAASGSRQKGVPFIQFQPDSTDIYFSGTFFTWQSFQQATDFGFTWETGFPRTWFATTLEIFSDPNCPVPDQHRPCVAF